MKNRNPSVVNLMRWLTPNPNLPDGLPADISREFQRFANTMSSALPDSQELSAGLRKLLEAKDCLVRAAIDATH